MNVELIIIASEILNGKILDLNTQWLAQFLLKNGIKLKLVTTIEDDPNEMYSAFKNAYERSDTVITSGGLGPTKDDLTKNIFSKFFNLKISRSQMAYDVVLKNYERFNREFIEEKSDYANVPELAVVYNNPSGMAPGLSYFLNQKYFAILPGVPNEFQSMFEFEIFPHIQKLFFKQNKFYKLVTVKTKMLPESKIFSEIALGLWEKLEGYGQVSSLPHILGVDIGVQISADSESELKNKEEDVLNTILMTPLKNHIWHIGNLSLEEVIIKEATEKKITIGTAESCTGGLVSSRLTNISNSSAVFIGGIVSYSNQLKITLLNVLDTTLNKFGAVSKETVMEMSSGAKEKLGVNIAISLSGIAGPTGGTKEKPVGTLCLGWISKDNQPKAETFNLAGDRVKLKERFSQIALYKLLEEIRNY